MKEKIKLTKKQYLGTGCLHFFRNPETDQIKVVEISDEEYNSMTNPNYETPKLDGYIWYQSGGGIIKVDNPDMQLGWNEYCDYEDGYFIFARNPNTNRILSKKVEKERIVDDYLDLTNI